MAGEKESRKSSKKKVAEDRQTTDYEKQRLLRIQENQEKLKSLRLPALASSLLENPVENSKDLIRRRRKSDDDKDDEYEPSSEDDVSEEEADEEDPSPRRKGTMKHSSMVKDENVSYKVGKDSLFSCMDEDDADLQQAIALSLDESKHGSVSEKYLQRCSSSGVQEKLKIGAKDAGASRRRRKGSMKRPQMTKEDLIAFFLSFDEVGKGQIGSHDLRRVASAHDFNWTDDEIEDMICLFSSSRCGRLSLEDFTKIVSQCNFLQNP